MPAENIVEVHHLKKSVGQGDQELSILTGVELVVKRAETIALIGESGSGKSTLLAILAGLDDGSSGEVSPVGQALHTMDEEAGAAAGAARGFCLPVIHVNSNPQRAGKRRTTRAATRRK